MTKVIEMSLEYFVRLFFTILVIICVVSDAALNSHISVETTDISSVGGGNYTYYILKHKGPMLLKLETLEGDADLYVSEEVEHPTFDLGEHSMSSWTFGSDVLYLPKIFGRPVYVGVYGHPRYDESRYVLTANFLEDEEYDPYKIQVEFDAKAQPHTSEREKESRNPKVNNFLLAKISYWYFKY